MLADTPRWASPRLSVGVVGLILGQRDLVVIPRDVTY